MLNFNTVSYPINTNPNLGAYHFTCDELEIKIPIQSMFGLLCLEVGNT